MNLMKHLGSTLTTAVLALMIGAPAASARPAAPGPPPPARVESTPAPGEVRIPGHWAYSGRNWIWVDGWSEPERPGYVYRAGSWMERDGQWVWVEGGWRKLNRADARGAKSVPASAPAPCKKPAGEKGALAAR
ncbi:MAG: YXWGXW repeat-containing protein [Myxococcales bacterium]|nr:YXWGXW repeat-containing protein [Myxococcales bacterium]MCB9733217.1 YXWGXW repeat-containing protein [Deltaproteobacteria bacterium]